jgi:hypothetical protein
MTNGVSVIDEFFAKWEVDTKGWYKAKKAEYKEIGYSAFSKKYHGILSKQTFELMRMKFEKGQGYTSVEDVIEKDMAIKKAKLLSKIAGKVGNIVELNLRCGADGTPNGKVTGDAGVAYISTIIAGGHNIQCLHYRVLVK